MKNRNNGMPRRNQNANDRRADIMAAAIFKRRSGLLKERILSDGGLLGEISESLAKSGRDGFFAVFISVGGLKSRALVFRGTGASVQNAWEQAYGAAEAAATGNKNYKVLWIKADIVDLIRPVTKLDLNMHMKEGGFPYFYRYGLAFDSNLGVAFLESEINANKMLYYYSEKQFSKNEIDFSSNRLNLDNVNHYMKKYYGSTEDIEMPEQLFEFTTRGFIADGDAVYDLYNDGLGIGRRAAFIDKNETRNMIMSASSFLARQIGPDGKFVYGYYPVFGNEIDSYNIVRHASSLWSLLNLFRMTGDRSVLMKLDKAIDYMISDYLEYKDTKTAYLVERASNEIKLGASGVAVILLTEYMDALKTRRYAEIVRHLANGIVALQDGEDGSFTHVLSFPDYNTAQKFRIVYYDGEAVFGLARAYSVLKDEIYLNAAKAGVEYFIRNDYTKYRDHWVAYALNEITKHLPEPRYFEFAMRNIKENLAKIYKRNTTYHTYLELLMIGFETYERLMNSGAKVGYMDSFSPEDFILTIFRRANVMANGFFYPEYAMYMKIPEQILGSFMIRHDSFRTRIDDVQHFIGGYYFYMRSYDRLRALLPERPSAPELLSPNENLLSY
ncbi:MAG: hypothetical protein FWG94_07655 [Oscillospiraceae bacterium]|nr:hypothetical protein [Oscillospiraceae bacterium]